jgi:hypothetical protein
MRSAISLRDRGISVPYPKHIRSTARSSQIALVDEIGQGQAAVGVVAAHRNHEFQVGLHQGVHGLAVACLRPHQHLPLDIERQDFGPGHLTEVEG